MLPGDTRVLFPPRHIAAVTARDALSTTGDERVLVSNNRFWVGFQDIPGYVGVVLPGTLRQFMLPHKKTVTCYPPRTLVTCVTVPGKVHPWIRTASELLYWLL